jgi:hypothetical protein
MPGNRAGYLRGNLSNDMKGGLTRPTFGVTRISGNNLAYAGGAGMLVAVLLIPAIELT